MLSLPSTSPLTPFLPSKPSTLSLPSPSPSGTPSHLPLLVETELPAAGSEAPGALVADVDAVVTLPGSTGTLEELFDVLSAKKLGLFTKPVILLNTYGFFTPLLEMLNKIVEENFMRTEHLKIFTVVNSAEEVIPAILQSEPWSENAFNFSAV